MAVEVNLNTPTVEVSVLDTTVEVSSTPESVTVECPTTSLTTENVQDLVASMLVAGANISMSYDDAAGTLTISSTGGGGGGSAVVVQKGDVDVVTLADHLDFGTGFGVTQSPTGEANITLNFLEAIQAFQDAMAVSLTAGANMSVTYDDPGNQIILAVTGLTSAQISDFSEAADDRIATLIQNGTGIAWTYNDVSNTLTGNVSLASFTTTNLAEGSNLYFTNERVDDRVAALLQQGSNITLTYNDPSNTLTIAVSGLTSTALSDFAEAVDDRVAALIQNGTGLTWTYVDASNTLTGNVSLASFNTGNLAEGSNLYYTDERVDDRVAALLVAGANITLTYNDAANTLTVAATGGGASLTPTAVKTANYTAAAGDLVPCDLATTGSFTVTLPNAPADKTVVAVEVVAASGTRTATIATAGTDKFDFGGGAATKTLRNLAETLYVQYKSSNGIWYTLSQPSASQVTVQNNGSTIGARGTLDYDPSATFGWTVTDDGTAVHISGRVVKFGGLATWAHSFSQQDGAEGTVGNADNYVSHIAAALNIPFTEAKMRGRSGAQATSPGIGEPTQVDGVIPAEWIVRNETCNTTSGSATVTDSTALASFVGREVHGPGIPPGTTVVSVTPSTSFVMSANARQTLTGTNLVIGDQQGLGSPIRHMLPPHWYKRKGHDETRWNTAADPVLNIVMLGINDPLRDWTVAGTIGVNAYKHGIRTFCSLRRLRSLYAFDDASIAYTGTWATVTTAQSIKGKMKRSSTSGDSFTITLPDSFPVDANGNATLSVFLFGQPNGSTSNYSTSTNTHCDWSGTVAAATGNTIVGGQGTGETGIQMVKRFALTAADRGKTIIGTMSNQLHSDSLDVMGWGFEDTVPPAIILVNTPEQGGAALANFFSGSNIATYNNALTSVQGEFDASVAVADIKTPFGKVFNAYLDANLSVDTTANHTAQSIVIVPVDVTQNICAVGHVLRIGVGAPSEEVLVTAIDKTNGGLNNGKWLLTVTRNYNGYDTGDAAVVVAAASNAGGTAGDLIENTLWLCPDRVHPSGFGHRYLAAQILNAIGTLPQTDSQVAGSGGYGRSMFPSIPDSGKIWLPGTHYALATAVGAPNVNQTLSAQKVLIPEDIIATGIQWEITLAAGAGGTGRVGIYADANGLPGELLCEGDSTVANDGATGVRTATMFKPLKKGYYWLAYVPQNNAAVGTLRCTHAITQVPGICIGGPSSSPLGGNVFDINGVKIPSIGTGALPSPFGNVSGQTIQWLQEISASPFAGVPALVLLYTTWVKD